MSEANQADMEAGKSFYELCEEPPRGCEAVADLAHWSTNYDLAGGTPFQLFLDLVGVSADEFGCRMFPASRDPGEVLGYVECAKLGAALVEYADAPSLVRDFCLQLVRAED